MRPASSVEKQDLPIQQVARLPPLRKFPLVSSLLWLFLTPLEPIALMIRSVYLIGFVYPARNNKYEYTRPYYQCYKSAWISGSCFFYRARSYAISYAFDAK